MPYRPESDILTSALGAPSRAPSAALWRAIYSHDYDGVDGDYDKSNVDGGAVAADNTYYRHSAHATPQGIKMKCGSASTSTKLDHDLTDDVTDLWARLEFYLHDDAEAAKLSDGMMFTLTPDTSKYNLLGLYTAPPGGAVPGWHDTILPLGVGQTVGSYDPAATAEARVQFETDAAGDQPTITLDRVSYWLPMEMARCAITLDDCPEHHWDLAVYAAVLGVPCTFFVHTSLAGTSGCLSMAQLRAMERMGHGIGCHGDYQIAPSGHNGWSAFDATEKLDCLRRGIHRMRAHGLRAGSHIFATPGGQWDPERDWPLVRGLVDLVRSTLQRPANKESLWHPCRAPYVWQGANGVADTAIEDSVDDAIAYGGCTIPVVHAVTGGDVAKWKTAIDYVAAKARAGLILPVTMDALMQPIEPRRVYFQRGAEAANARTITIHTATAYADVLVYATEDGSEGEYGAPEAMTGLVVGAKGELIDTISANKTLRVLTNASGEAEITMTNDGTAETWYLHAVYHGKAYSTGALVFAA